MSENLTAIQKLELRRQALRDANDQAHEQQYAKDLERLVELEEEHGFERVLKIDVDGWQAGEGAATCIIVRLPKSSEHVFKRFQQSIMGNASEAKKAEAAELLGASCLVYPSAKVDGEAELYKSTIEIAPGILGHAAQQVVKKVQGTAAEEGK